MTYEEYLREEARIAEEEARRAEEEAWWAEHEEEVEAAWAAAEEEREKIYTKFPDVDWTLYEGYEKRMAWDNDESLRMEIDEVEHCIIYNEKCQDFFGDVVIKKQYGKLKEALDKLEEDLERRFYRRFAVTAGAQA